MRYADSREAIERTLLRKDIFTPGAPQLYVINPVVNGTHFGHDHDFLEIVVVVSGSGIHSSVHGEQPIGRGDLFVLRPGAWHRYRDCRDLRVYNCCFGPELLRRELSFAIDDSEVNWLLCAGPLAQGARGIMHRTVSEPVLLACVPHLDALVAGLEASAPFLANIGHLLLFVSHLASSLSPVSETISEVAAHPVVRQVMRLLEEDYAEEWSAADLAKHVRTHPAHLTRLFTATVGLAPIAYLNRYRAERAAHLLLQTDRPVGEIASAVGWHDSNYFSRRFKSTFGVTPSAYRQQQNDAG